MRQTPAEWVEIVVRRHGMHVIAAVHPGIFADPDLLTTIVLEQYKRLRAEERERNNGSRVSEGDEE